MSALERRALQTRHRERSVAIQTQTTKQFFKFYTIGKLLCDIKLDRDALLEGGLAMTRR